MAAVNVRTARELRAMLRRKYSRTSEAIKMPEYLVAFEVPIDGRPRWADMPEVRARQRVDAVAVGLWKRTEHLVHGFELKVTRADLMHELRDPTKSAAAVTAFDRWWLVIGNPALLRDDDPLPAGWGVLEPRGNGLGVRVPADPQAGDLDRRTLAGIMQASMRSHGACRGLGVVDGATNMLRRLERNPALAQRVHQDAVARRDRRG